METSLRYGGDSKSLRIHAKEKFPLHYNTHLQLHGELDTKIGAPSHLNAMIRYNYPDLFAGIGVGVQYNRQGCTAFSKASCRTGSYFNDRYTNNQVFSQLVEYIASTLDQKIGYCVRGKKAFPVTPDGLVSFNIKGRCDVNQEFKQKKSSGAAELSWTILNFKKDQDVRLKVGYEIFDKISYMQIRESNWTLNANSNGKWNVRYDL